MSVRRISLALSVVVLAALGIWLALSPSPTGPGRADTAAAGDELPLLDITVRNAPSNSIWLPTLIQQLGLDRKHGFQLRFREKSGTSTYLDLAQGEDIGCLCVDPLVYASFVEQGAPVTLLFTIFEDASRVVVLDPAIAGPRDLAGRSLSVNTATGRWSAQSFLFEIAGLDLGDVTIHSAAGAGTAVADLVSGRVDAIMTGPVEMANLAEQNVAFSAFQVFDEETWRAAIPNGRLPSIMFGVNRDWWADAGNKALARAFFAALREAADYAVANPEQAAETIGAHTRMPRAAVLYALTNFPEVLHVAPAQEYEPTLRFFTQHRLPAGGFLARGLTDDELGAYVSDFAP